jgi:cysteine-rich repeat protein
VIEPNVKRFVWLLVMMSAAAGAGGCSDDDRPGAISAQGGAGGSSGTGQSGSAGALGGGAGQAGSGASSGLGGAGGTADFCGDGLVGAGEDCDGANLAGNDCSTVGFQIGTLACTAGCTFDKSGCSGSEQCFDNKDNDGDGLIDCADPDCAAACSDSCANPPLLPDPASVTGSTKGHAAQSDPSCSRPGVASGPEVVYQFVPSQTGVLDLKLTTAFALNVSVRTGCDNPSTELGCKAGKRLRIPVTAGTPLFVVVDGIEAKDAGAYLLEAESRVIACGDGHRDGSEACDDGNTTSGDGCSSSCTLEATESEPNDTLATANPQQSPFFGAISSASDVDLVAVTVSQTPSTIIADTFDLGDGACGWDELDSVLELLSPSGSVLASDDDGGAGLCAHLVKSGLAAGTYYVRVKAAPDGDTPSFPYKLSLIVDPCGNGIQVEGEACDDGNKLAGDGCSPTCTIE